MKIKLLAATAMFGLAMPALQAAPPAPTQNLTPMAGQTAQDYVAHAADGDMYEMASSKMALERSKKKPTRVFAQMMVRDHTKSTAMIQKAAGKASVAVPTAPTPETQAKLDALKATPDADFDKAYSDGQKQAHDMAWTVHSGYAADGSDAGLKATATSIKGVVETHMRHLADLATM